MRIGVDYTAAARQGGGIGRYTRELVSALLAMGTEEHTYILMAAVAGLGSRWQRETSRLRTLVTARERLIVRPLPLTDDWLARLWQRLRLPIPAELITGSVDVFYSPDFVLPPLLPRTRGMLTVHDLSFIRHPETFPNALRRYLEKTVPRSVARADHIFADSEATRQDLVSLLNTPAGKISVLYSGVSARFTPQAEPDERSRLQARYDIGACPYILSLGTVQPRKNYVRLMQACDQVKVSAPFDLIIVGRPAWLSAPIVEAAEQRPNAHLLGFVEDEDLPALYRQAALFAFPSLYEGFGIPPLEAMACRTPVVASSASSVPEVVGDAGILVNPLDVPAWAEALTQGLEDKSLRADLQERGLSRVKHFTWAKAAERWLEIVDIVRHS